MTKHEYAYDIKMFAIIRLYASDKKEAERLLTLAINNARLTIDSVDPEVTSAITDTAINVDDVLGPWLFEIDGEDVD